VKSSTSVALFRGPLEELRCLSDVFRDSQTIKKTSAIIRLAIPITVLGGAAPQFCGARGIPAPSQNVCVKAQPSRIVLVGRHSKIFRRLVAPDSQAICDLCPRVALVCGFFEELHCLGILTEENCIVELAVTIFGLRGTPEKVPRTIKILCNADALRETNTIVNLSPRVALVRGNPELTRAARGVGAEQATAELEAAIGVALSGGGLEMAETIRRETAPETDVPGSDALRGGLREERGRAGDVARDARAGQQAVREQQLPVGIRLRGRQLVVGRGQGRVPDDAEPALEAEPVVHLAERVARIGGKLEIVRRRNQVPAHAAAARKAQPVVHLGIRIARIRRRFVRCGRPRRMGHR
jgi:hypothetical protein